MALYINVLNPWYKPKTTSSESCQMTNAQEQPPNAFISQGSHGPYIGAVTRSQSRQTTDLGSIPEEELNPDVLDNCLDPELQLELPKGDLSPEVQTNIEDEIPITGASKSTLEHESNVVPEAESTAAKEEPITSYQKRNTLVGYQLHNKCNKSRIPEGTTVPIIVDTTSTPTASNHDVITPPDSMDFQEPKPLFTEERKVPEPRRMPRQCELQEFIDLVRKRAIRDFTLPLKAQDISQAQKKDPFVKPAASR